MLLVNGDECLIEKNIMRINEGDFTLINSNIRQFLIKAN